MGVGLAWLGRRWGAISGRVTPPDASGGEIALWGVRSGPRAAQQSRRSAVNPYTIRHVRIGFAFVQHM